MFGSLQSKMFPAYFSMVAVCCAVSTASFGYLHPWKSSSTAEKYQLGFLLSAFAFNLTNLLVFTPMTIEVYFSQMYGYIGHFGDYFCLYVSEICCFPPFLGSDKYLL